MNSVRKNFLYNASYNILALIMPLITSPYISRVMGAELIGIHSYCYSIASYFGIFILLGLNNYGNRTIAEVKDNRENLSKTFCSIYIVQLIMAFVVIVLYIIYVIYLSQNKIMAWIQLIYLLSVALDINWFFFGMEKFKLTVTRNTVIKITSVGLILTLVKEKDDIYIYGLIMAISPILSQIFLWFFLKDYVKLKKVSLKDIIRHIKPNLVLFIPVIAVSLYTTMSKIILGSLSSMEEVGLYESSSRLTQVPAMAITSLGTVMLPRMTNLIAQGKRKEAMKYIEKSLIVSMALSSAIAFGIGAVVDEFVPLFFGEGFDKCGNIITLLVLSAIFISWANVIRTQYLIPNKKDKIFIISVFIGAVVNIVLNFAFIPKLGAVGAALSTFVVEFCVCAYQTYKIRKDMEINKYLKESLPILIGGIIMYIVTVNIPYIYNNFATLIIKMIIGATIYIVFSLSYYVLKLRHLLINDR